MKKLIVLATLLVLILGSCSGDSPSDAKDEFKSDGSITGFDYRKCMCCGGWIIDIADSTYRFYQLPDGSNIDLAKETFPLEVRLDWHQEEKACVGVEIIVERIRKK